MLLSFPLLFLRFPVSRPQLSSSRIHSWRAPAGGEEWLLHQHQQRGGVHSWEHGPGTDPGGFCKTGRTANSACRRTFYFLHKWSNIHNLFDFVDASSSKLILTLLKVSFELWRFGSFYALINFVLQMLDPLSMSSPENSASGSCPSLDSPLDRSGHSQTDTLLSLRCWERLVLKGQHFMTSLKFEIRLCCFVFVYVHDF